MSYTGGKHDDPADTQDRLVRVGAKYNATVPSIADGDNAHILVSAEGRPRTEEYTIQQARLNNGKFTQAQLSKTTAASEVIGSWTVTNGKDGYLTKIFVSVQSHASETLHLITAQSENANRAVLRRGQGDDHAEWTFDPPMKIVGNGSKTFRVLAQQDTVNSSIYNVTLMGWEE